MTLVEDFKALARIMRQLHPGCPLLVLVVLERCSSSLLPIYITRQFSCVSLLKMVLVAGCFARMGYWKLVFLLKG